MFPKTVILFNLYAVLCEAFAPPMTPQQLSFPLWSTSLASVDGASATTVEAPSVDREESEAQAEENTTKRDFISLDSIRANLIRKEETIIFALIERAQHCQNNIVYEVGGISGLTAPPGSVNCKGEDLSFLDFMLTGTVSLWLVLSCYYVLLSSSSTCL